MQPSITFYDIPSNLPEPFSPSPNTWKIRYALNFKGLTYTTTWVEYPDIEALYKKLSVEPVLFGPDGSPYFTLPMIHDHLTNRFISDSPAIARYLDETYPNTPALFPFGKDSYPLHNAFTAILGIKVVPLYPLTVSAMHKCLNPASQGFFKVGKEKMLGASFEQLLPKDAAYDEAWQKIRADFEGIEKWIGTSNYFAGEQLSFADMEIGAFMMWMKVIFGGEDSKEWKIISSWSGGRWADLVKTLEKYSEVV